MDENDGTTTTIVHSVSGNLPKLTRDGMGYNALQISTKVQIHQVLKVRFLFSFEKNSGDLR